MKLGLGSTISKIAVIFASLTRGVAGYVRDNLKLYMPFGTATEVKYVGGGSALFDGSNDYVNCGSDSTLDNIFDGGGTISAWIYPNSDGEGNEARIVDKRDDGTGFAFHVITESSGTCMLKFFQNFDSTSGQYLSTADVTISAWNHVTVTYDSSGAGASYVPTFYVNGVASTFSSSTNSAGTAVTDAAENFIIGNTEAGIRTFDGRIKNVGAWSRVLSQTEIQNVMYKTYGQLVGTEEQGLVGWWGLDRTYIDSTDNDNDGTNSGSVITFSKYGDNVPKIPRGVDNSPTARADTIGNGSALFVVGNEDYIGIADDASLDFGTGAFTISGWFKQTAANSTIIAKGTYNGVGDWLIYEASANFEFRNDDNSGDKRIEFSNATLNGTGWHHFAVTRNGTTVKTYLDGVYKNSGTLEADYDFTNAHNVTIGGREDGTGRWADGNIAQVGVWVGALTQAEIQEVKEKSFAELSASDKSSLGAELITAEGDRTFATSYGNWANYQSGTVGWDSNGYLELTTADGAASGLQLAGSNITDVVVGDIVKAQFDVKLGTMADDAGGNSITGIGGGAISFVATSSWQTVVGYFVADSTNPNLYLKAHVDNCDGGTLLFDNISLKVVTHDLVSYWTLDEANDNSVADKMDETLGSELITNGDLSSGTNGWYDDNNATFEVIKGQLHAITSSSYWDGVRHQVTAGVTAGKIYKITFDYRIVSGTNISLYVFTNDTGTSNGSDTSSSVSKTLTATTITTETRYWLCSATNTTARISFVNGSTASREIYIDNLSVKEVGGNPGVLL